MTKAKEKWPLEAVSVIHRVGHMEPKDAIVFVAAASSPQNPSHFLEERNHQ